MPEESFRQVDEKHVTVEAELMVWSPKFDLVALANVNGEVVLHRLSWQKVWSLPAHTEDARVKAMAWRPDGKVLAVGYTTGHMLLCYIENADILHSIDLQQQVTCLSWVAQSLPGGEAWSCDPYLPDNTDSYLPRLQPLSKSYGSLSKGNRLNVLVVGSGCREVELYIYGVFPVARVNINDDITAQV
ncbi:APC4-like protein [Mya arenaria]|uniref:APC4-like protein n=1 Tax=Mya arenaria TaxID=6604 RepID=A0ABY7FH47_MYAAR|nr:APC4-like protein [Mya arenaria]